MGTKAVKRVRHTSSAIPNEMSFRIVVYPSESPNRFVAHALEVDIVGTGPDVQAAVAELLEMIELQAEMAAETGAELAFMAPPAVWKKYNAAKKAGRKIAGELMERIFAEANKRLGYTEPQVDHRIDNMVASRRIPMECLQV